MKELLDEEEKQALRDKYRNHPLYKWLYPSCKQFEEMMPNLQFSPEEVMLGVSICLDDYKENEEEAYEASQNLWSELVVGYRKRSDNIPIEEIHLAVCEVMYATISCLSILNSAMATMIITEMLNQMYTNAPDILQSVTEVWDEKMCMKEGVGHEMEAWITEYINGYDFYLSEEIDILVSEVAGIQPEITIAEGHKHDLVRLIKAMADSGYFKNIRNENASPSEVANYLLPKLGWHCVWDSKLQAARKLKEVTQLETFDDLRTTYKNYLRRI